MKRHYVIVALIMCFWFVISFITNIIGPLIPDIIDDFQLSHLASAAFIPTSFFIAYGIMSIPSGIMIEKLSEKVVLFIGFFLPLIGSILFALNPSFPVLLCSSFIIGLGMAMLQTVINPLTRVAGGEENFAFFSVLGQLIFGIASFISPFVYTNLVAELKSGQSTNLLVNFLSKITTIQMPWLSLYWIFTVILAITLLVVSCVKFPKIKLQEDEKSNGLASYKELFHDKKVYLFFFGILAYVATEQGVANWISEFLRQYHGLDAQREGASVVGWFWGLMSIGCLLGLVALKLWNAKIVLKVAGGLSLTMLLLALFASKEISVWAFPMMGFSISVMFSIIMSVGLNSVSRHHGSFAGILCSGIVGGAVGPLIVGWLGDIFGLRIALLFLILTLLYIISIAFIAKPLIENKTIKLKKRKWNDH
jgi:fucose permease